MQNGNERSPHPPPTPGWFHVKYIWSRKGEEEDNVASKAASCLTPPTEVCADLHNSQDP